MSELSRHKPTVKKSYNWISIFLVFLFLIFGTFFAFKIFGKTTHNIEFSVNGITDFSCEEILDIKVYKSNNSVETVRGNRISINDGETLKIQVSLNEGFDVSKNLEGRQALSATNISSSSNDNQISISEGEFFEWKTDAIKSDRNIKFYGISRKKLNVEEPRIINVDGENLTLKDFCNEWKNYFNYDEKYEFKLNLNSDDCYVIKQVVAKIKENDEDILISSKINNLSNHDYSITLYDGRSKFGGIKDPITDIEILLEIDDNCEKHDSDDLEDSQSERKVNIIGSDEVLEDSNTDISQYNEKIFESSLENAASQSSEVGIEEIPPLEMFTSMLYNARSGDNITFNFLSSDDNIPLNDAISNITISGDINNSDITLPNISGETWLASSLLSDINSTNEVSIEFTVKEGYEIESISSYNVVDTDIDENEIINAVDNKFSIPNIDPGNYNITVNLKKKKGTVTFKTYNNIDIDSCLDIEYNIENEWKKVSGGTIYLEWGSKPIFRMKGKDTYSDCTSSIDLSSNSLTPNKDGWKYTPEYTVNSEMLEITISGVEKNKRSVKFSIEDDSNNVIDINSVEIKYATKKLKDDDFEKDANIYNSNAFEVDSGVYFYIKPIGKYSQTELNDIKFDGEPVTSDSVSGYKEFSCTITNVETKTITISGLKLNEYSVSFNGDNVSTESIEIKYAINSDSFSESKSFSTNDETKFKVGSTVYFYIKPSGKCSQTKLADIKFNGQDNLDIIDSYKKFSYEIQNIDNQTITISGLKLNEYFVTFNGTIPEKSVEIWVGSKQNSDGNISWSNVADTKQASYHHGTDVYFYVKTIGEYTNSELTISPDFGVEVEDVEHNSSTVKAYKFNITTDAPVTISGLKLNTYPLTFKFRRSAEQDGNDGYLAIKREHVKLIVKIDEEELIPEITGGIVNDVDSGEGDTVDEGTNPDKKPEGDVGIEDDDVVNDGDVGNVGTSKPLSYTYYVPSGKKLNISVTAQDVFQKSTLNFRDSKNEDIVGSNTENATATCTFTFNSEGGKVTSDTIYVDGFNIPMYSMKFTLPENIPADAFEIYSYKGEKLGQNGEWPALNSNNSTKLNSENSGKTYFVYNYSYEQIFNNSTSCILYMKPTKHYSKSSWKYTGMVENGPESSDNYKVFTFALTDDNQNFDISGLTLNTYTVTFKVADDTNYKLLDRVNVNKGDQLLSTNTDSFQYTDQDSTYTLTAKEGYTISSISESNVQFDPISFNKTTVKNESGIVTITFRVESDVTVTISEVPFETYEVYVDEGLAEYGSISYEYSTLKSDVPTNIMGNGITPGTPLKLKLNDRYFVDSDAKVVIYEVTNADGEVTKGNIISSVNFQIGDKNVENYYPITITPDNAYLKGDIIIGIENIKEDYPEITFVNNSNSGNSAKLDGNNNNWSKPITTTGKEKGYYLDFSISTVGSRYYMPTTIERLKNGYITVGSGELVFQENAQNDAQTLNLRLYVTDDTTLTLNKLDYRTFDVKFNVAGSDNDSILNELVQIYAIKNKDTTNCIDSNLVFKKTGDISVDSYVYDDRNNSDYFAVKILDGAKISKLGLKLNNVGSTLSDGYYIFKVSDVLSDINKAYNSKDVTVNVSGIEKEDFTFDFSNIQNTDTSEYEFTVIRGEENIIVNDKKAYLNYGDSVKITFKKTKGGNFKFPDLEIPLDITVEDINGNKYYGWTEASRTNTEFSINIPKVDRSVIFEITEEVNLVSYISLSNDNLVFHKVEASDDNKYTIGNELEGELECGRGKSCYFAVKLKDSNMYNISTVGIGNKDKALDVDKVKDADIKLNNTKENSDDYLVYIVTVPNNENAKNYNIEMTVGLNNYEVTFNKNGILAKNETSGDVEIDYTEKNCIDNGDNNISDFSKIPYGSNVKFKIKIPDTCSRSIPDIQVKMYHKKNNDIAPETILKDTDGYYTIYNITDNLEIKVENLKWNRYTIVFPEVKGLKFMVDEGSNKYSDYTNNIYSVIQGNNCNFKITTNEGYNWAEENQKVNAKKLLTDGTYENLALECKDGEYTLSSIQSDYTISVVDAEILSYSVEFLPVDGVTYQSELGVNITGGTLKYGSNYEFSVAIADDYSDSVSGMYPILTPNGVDTTVQKLSSSRYIIQHVAGDIKIKMANVVKNKYPITLTDAEGIDYYDSSGRLITGENIVDCGSNFSFKVKLYTSYIDSKIRVMLGNVELEADDDGMYTVESIYEAKTVTVVGIEKTAPAKLVDDINKLPQTIENSEDVDLIISASKAYDTLDDSRKPEVTNYNVLKNLQEKLTEYHHISNGVTLEGLGWHIKLIANPIMSNIEACARIYEKLNTEYIISLYDVYLWDTLNDQRYKLSEGEVAVVHLPTPDMSYFKDPTGIHESDDGKIDYLTLNMTSATTTMETSSLSPVGIIANRSSAPGRSSLIDAIDANLSYLTDYTLTALTGKPKDSDGRPLDSSSYSDSDIQSDNTESEDNDYKVVDNSKKVLGSALKLILILMIIAIILAIIFALLKRKKENDNRNSD